MDMLLPQDCRLLTVLVVLLLALQVHIGGEVTSQPSCTCLGLLSDKDTGEGVVCKLC
jgi:hypothetical protein